MHNTLWIVKTLLKYPIDMRVLISSILLIGLFACSQENKQPEQVASAEMKPASNALMLTESQIKLGNISTQIVTKQSIGQTLPVNARLVANEELTEVISSRATGRIEKLFVKEAGRMVNKGEPLYELYSESLLTFQKEYLLALEQFKSMKALDNRRGYIQKGYQIIITDETNRIVWNSNKVISDISSGI